MIRKILLFCMIVFIFVLPVSAGLISEPSFETVNNWTYSENDADFSGAQSTAWVTLDSYSYLLSVSGLSASTYGRINQSVNFTNLSYIRFDANVNDPLTGSYVYYVKRIKINDDIVWFKKNTGVYLNQTVVVSSYNGINNLSIELAYDGTGGGAHAGVSFYIDNIRENWRPTAPTSFTNLGNNLTDHTPTITWTKGTDPDSDAVTTYIYVGTTSTPTDEEGNTTSETFDLGNIITLLDGVTYYYRLRSWDGYSWSDYTTADEFRMNSDPTIPSISSPSNNSYHTSQPITIQANSTDADGDSITYYFYGDTVDGSTLLGTSTNGTYVWHQALSGDYILKVRAHDGYEYGDYSNLVYFHSLIPPLLTTDLIQNGSFENWSSGPNVAPDGWVHTSNNGIVNREGTIKKNNLYSVKIITVGAGSYSQIHNVITDFSQYAGKTLTLGMWVYSSNDRTRIIIEDDEGRTYSYHSGSGDWEWLTATRTIDATPTKIFAYASVDTNNYNYIAYYDSAILVEGAYPYVSEPLNNSIHTFDFPPLLHDLTFVWQDSDADGYKYQIATDENFNLISEEGSLSTYTTDVSLTAGDYFWRLFAYDPITDTYSDSSDVWQFTINETTVSDGTAIDGVVYEITNAGSIAVEGALVNIWNNTWSNSMLVGQNGYYYFDGVDNSTYSLRATKTGYTDSAIELVTAASDATTTRNILLQSTSGAGQQYVDHYVKFIVKSLIGTLYSDVEVNVYLGDAVIPQYTGTTGTDGSVAFELNEYQEYRITFGKTSPSIDKEITLYPKDDSYTVYVDIGTMIDDLLNPDDEEQAITAIDVSVTKTIINDNTANITVNYNDIMDETSGLTLTLSQSIAGNTTNKTVLSTVDLGTANNTAYNFTVTNYNGESYFIEVTATHTTHGAIYRMYGIQFENTDTLFGFTVEVVGWLAIIFITWFALTATSITVQHTAIGVCALATAMIAIGWGSYISMSGLGLAWIMSLAANFAHAKEASA